MAISGGRGGGDCSVATTTLLEVTAWAGGEDRGRANNGRKGLPISPIKIDGMQCMHLCIRHSHAMGGEGLRDDGC